MTTVRASDLMDPSAMSDRYAFGQQWQRFLRTVDDHAIDEARDSLVRAIGTTDLSGKRVLDIGSGSGLFSLAAWRLGATSVRSFDYDPDSVACTAEVQRRYAAGADNWTIEQGSVVDPAYMAQLGHFDLVYAWGVLHHTGAMWPAIENAGAAVAEGGQLFIAIYNDQGWISRYWLAVKRAYNAHAVLRWLVIALHAPYLLGIRALVRALTGRWRLERGMSLWTDMFDWLGGYPFEVATPQGVEAFLAARDLTMTWSREVGRRLGTNEFLFVREDEPRAP